MQTYYDLFGLPFGAPESQVKQRYRELAKRFHPDVNPSPEAAHQMQLLNEAYRILTTPHLRLAYHLRMLALIKRQKVRMSAEAQAHRVLHVESARSGIHLVLLPLIGVVVAAALTYHWMHPFPFQKLDLRRFQLKKLPSYLYLPTSIQRIDLSYNRFTSIPSEIEKLPLLASLNMSHNRLRELSSRIAYLHRLEELDLSHNQISALPLGIGEMMRLRRLYLRGNRLTDLPEELFLLPNIELLDVRDNPLSPTARDRLRNFQANTTCQVMW
ncbi:MAG: DnaJ domain-containing protein [Bacteroidia bacterium]|nr:DnaJ domain-containing protein [Bacteroidia bacterium]MCX7651367.1 DnaJ domain-containing protein [Bacteroidia bacterium]MDW8416733.1 DnaJ domain-containing protein [Bacteroidia bacterium]